MHDSKGHLREFGIFTVGWVGAVTILSIALSIWYNIKYGISFSDYILYQAPVITGYLVAGIMIFTFLIIMPDALVGLASLVYGKDVTDAHKKFVSITLAVIILVVCIWLVISDWMDQMKDPYEKRKALEEIIEEPRQEREDFGLFGSVNISKVRKIVATRGLTRRAGRE